MYLIYRVKSKVNSDGSDNCKLILHLLFTLGFKWEDGSTSILKSPYYYLTTILDPQNTRINIIQAGDENRYLDFKRTTPIYLSERIITKLIVHRYKATHVDEYGNFWFVPYEDVAFIKSKYSWLITVYDKELDKLTAI